MLRLLLRRAPTASGRPASSPLPSSASSAGLAPPLHSMLLSSAATASLCPPSALRSALSPRLMQSPRVSSLLAAQIARSGIRSFHCCGHLRVEDESNSGGDASKQGKQNGRGDLGGSPSKDARKAQHRKGANKSDEHHATSKDAAPAVAGSKAESKQTRFAAATSTSAIAPAESTGRGRSNDRTPGGRRGRGNSSSRDHAARATKIYPFRFDTRSGQSEQLQSTFHQLRALSYQYTDTFPTKRTAITDRIDITQKSDWQSMRARATQVRALRTPRTISTQHDRALTDCCWLFACLQLLDSLLQLSSSADSGGGRLTLAQCQNMLHRCKQLRLVEEPLLVLGAMLETGSRIPAKCVSMLLECVVKSVQWSAASGGPAPCGDHPALSVLRAGRPPPSAELRGVELAEWMLAAMLSPTLHERFEINVFVWTAVLDGLIQATRHRNDPSGLQRARAFYERIPNKDAATHNMMLTAYRLAGMQTEQHALMQLIQADPIAAASSQITNARLAQIHVELNTPQRQADQAANRSSKLTARECTLLHEVAQLWSAAMKRPAERMSSIVTGATLKVWALLGDIPRMIAIIGEAIEAEQAQSLVLVDPACYCQLFDSLSASADPARWKAEANDAWEQMQQRHADARKSQLLERANVLRMDQATLNAYARFLQLTHQRGELDRLWLSAPRHLTEANPQIFLARLKVLAKDGDSAAAERVISEMASFNVRPDEQHFASWLGCYRNAGRWAEAERVWLRMVTSGVKSHSSSYRNLMTVYMDDGSPEQVAKIDPLYAEMLRACPEGMEAGDYQHLIKTAHVCRLPSEARKWSERAKAAGLWETLDDASHTIVARIAQWQDLPRDSQLD